MARPVNRLRSMKACRCSLNVAVAIALCLLAFGSARLLAQETAEASKLPRGLAEVVKLVGSGVGDDVVISYIQNSPVPKPTANDLIELHRAKVPSPVIVALLSKPQKPIAEAPVAAAPVAETKPAPAVQQVISAPAPQTVYVRQPVYVQRDPVVVYGSPAYYGGGYYGGPGYYRGSGWDWAGFGIGLGLGHFFGHYGHHGHFAHHGFGHHGGLHVRHH
jgi:hypothetical protein